MKRWRTHHYVNQTVPDQTVNALAYISLQAVKGIFWRLTQQYLEHVTPGYLSILLFSLKTDRLELGQGNVESIDLLSKETPPPP